MLLRIPGGNSLDTHRCVEGAVVLATVKDEPLRGGLTAILDRRCARQAAGSAGRDDGMAVLVEQQDGGLDEALFPDGLEGPSGVARLRMLSRRGPVGVISTGAAALLDQQRLHLAAVKSPDLIA
jgi:hypothetical protein